MDSENNSDGTGNVGDLGYKNRQPFWKEGEEDGPILLFPFGSNNWLYLMIHKIM